MKAAAEHDAAQQAVAEQEAAWRAQEEESRRFRDQQKKGKDPGAPKEEEWQDQGEQPVSVKPPHLAVPQLVPARQKGQQLQQGQQALLQPKQASPTRSQSANEKQRKEAEQYLQEPHQKGPRAASSNSGHTSLPQD